MSDDKSAPSWFFDKLDDKSKFSEEYISQNDAQKLSSTSINDNDLVAQRDEIEKCAKAGKQYIYNSDWDAKTRAELKEYALACGMNMDKFKSVASENIQNILSIHKEVNIVKEENEAKMQLKDPFKIDEINNKKAEVENWEKIGKQKNLNDRPDIDSRVIPVRGGDDITKNSSPKISKGQNSILDPDAIKRAIESREEDTGARLKREKAEKEASKITRHESWEKEKIEAMSGKGIIPNRKVFPTEVMNAQSGIKDKPFDFDKVPDQTAGEKLKESQVARKKSIRGEEKQKYDFKLEAGKKTSVSDTFAEELKKGLKK